MKINLIDEASRLFLLQKIKRKENKDEKYTKERQ